MFISRRCDLFHWSSEDVAVVVDFHWFTDCHLEAIFNMNTSRVQLRSSITVDGKDIRLTAGVSLSESGSARYSSAPSITTVWSIRLHITTSLKSLSQKRWLYHQILTWSFWPVQLSQCKSINVTWPIVLRPHWSNRLQLIYRYQNHKYVNVQTSVVDPQ